MIPAEGRDVQCSACGKVWFVTPQRSAGAETASKSLAERVPDAAPEQVAVRGSAPEAETRANAAPQSGALPTEEATPVAVARPDNEAGDRQAATRGTEAASVTEAVSGVAEAEEVPATRAGETPPEEPMAPARRTVTPAIADILRAEAKRERAARAAEAQAALERQEEFPLTAPEGAASGTAPGQGLGRAAAGRGEGATTEGGDTSDDLAAAIKKIVAEEANRMVTDVSAVRGAASLDVPAAAVRAAEPPALTPAQLSAASRRDRLPDIEEISSTLSPAVALPPEEDDAPEPRRRSGSGFRLGFGIVLLLSTLLAMVYVYAPRIIAEVPQSEKYIRAYSDAVDEGRIWLDRQLNRVLDAVGTESGAGE